MHHRTELLHFLFVVQKVRLVIQAGIWPRVRHVRILHPELQCVTAAPKMMIALGHHHCFEAQATAADGCVLASRGDDTCCAAPVRNNRTRQASTGSAGPPTQLNPAASMHDALAPAVASNNEGRMSSSPSWTAPSWRRAQVLAAPAQGPFPWAAPACTTGACFRPRCCRHRC